MCGLSNTDLIYELVDESSPTWLTFDSEERIIMMNIDEESSFTASSVTVNIKATYAEFTKEMSFSVAYAGIDDSDEELAPVDSEEEEPEPESESEAESEPEVID